MHRKDLRTDIIRGACALALAAAFLLAAQFGRAADRVVLKIGDRPPSFVLTDAAGKVVSIPEDGSGRVVIIHFWADWCPYCVSEMPALERLFQQHRQNGLVVYGVNVGQSRDAVIAFGRKYGLTYTLLLDADSGTAKRYGVEGLPRTFFLDRKGNIKYKLLGEASEQTLQKLVQKTL